jgi:hypothetical protein
MLLVFFASAASSAQEERRTAHRIPHTAYIQCPSHSLGASLELDEKTGNYVGFARDNYENSKYPVCTYTPEEIRCEGVWSYSKTAATLVIRFGADGKLVGNLTRSFEGRGTASMECVGVEKDLGECVMNPGTNSCTLAPWNHRH